MLTVDDFQIIVKHSVLFAIDFIIRDENSKILLAKRLNKPASGYYFTPGGRVFKNETLQEALERILKAELGLNTSDLKNMKYSGIYEHFYDDNVFGNPDFDTHYIVVALEFDLVNKQNILIDKQHSEYYFFSIMEVINSPNVHEYVKNYLKNNPINKFP
mgnify:CR=1 FL=1